MHLLPRSLSSIFRPAREIFHPAQLNASSTPPLQFTEATGPIDLTPENFDASTANSKAAFVKFMAPWCGHCQTMAKAWSDLATKVHSEYKGVTIGTVNCDTQKEFCAMFEIQGLPTVRAATRSETQSEE